MNLRNTWGTVLVALTLVTAGSVAPTPGARTPVHHSPAPRTTETEAIQAMLRAAFDAKYRSLLKGNHSDLHRFYAPTPSAQGLARQELARLDRHWSQVAERHGFAYTGVEIDLDFQRVDFSSSTEATVSLVEEGRLSHVWNDSGLAAVEQYGNLVHIVTVVKCDGTWRIQSDDYHDMFQPQRGSEAPNDRRAPPIVGERPVSFCGYTRPPSRWPIALASPRIRSKSWATVGTSLISPTPWPA